MPESNFQELSPQQLKSYIETAIWSFKTHGIEDTDLFKQVISLALNFDPESESLKKYFLVQVLDNGKTQAIVDIPLLISNSNINRRNLGLDPWNSFELYTTFCDNNIERFGLGDFMDEIPLVCILES